MTYSYQPYVVDITPFTGERVTMRIDNREIEYTRYGRNCWYRVYGESEEAEYSLEEVLEKAYNYYLNK